MPVKLIEMKSKLATSSSFNSLIIATKKPQKSEPDKQYLYIINNKTSKTRNNFDGKCWICGEGRSGTCLASMSRYLPAPIALSISAMEGRCRLFCCCCCFFLGRDVVVFVVCMGGLVGLVWIGGRGGGGEPLVGREARARGLVMERQDKQYMVSLSVCYFHLVWIGWIILPSHSPT